MADVKITALAVLTAADPINDAIPIVDVSDVTMAASGTTKRISVNNLLSSSPTASGALTVTGLVTAGSATITGNLTVDTTTLVVDSTNNRVGVGTATPGFTLDVNSAAGTIIRTKGGSGSNQGSAFYVTAAGSASTLFAAGDRATIFGGTPDVTASIFTGSGIPLTFDVNGSTAMTLNTTGNLVLKGGTAAATGVGVTFPAAQIVSSDANCLDDYEEGTWVGTLTGTTTPATPIIATGKYTKIGREVYVQINFENISNTGYVGYISITGLPFSSATAPAATQGSVRMDSIGTFTGSTFSYISNAASIIDIYQNISNSGATPVDHNAGSGRFFYVNHTYTV